MKQSEQRVEVVIESDWIGYLHFVAFSHALFGPGGLLNQNDFLYQDHVLCDQSCLLCPNFLNLNVSERGFHVQERIGQKVELV